MSNEIKILRTGQVLKKLGIKTTTLYKLIKAKEFPEPIKIIGTTNGWLESVVDDWILKRAGALPANDDQHQQAA